MKKEPPKIKKSLSDLIAAIESGILTESPKDRLHELEKEEKSKTSKAIRSKVIKYTTEVLKQASKNLIDLLIRKIIIKDEEIDIYLNYANPYSPDYLSKNETDRQNKITPLNGQNPNRGVFFMQLNYNIEPERKQSILFNLYIFTDFSGVLLSLNPRSLCLYKSSQTVHLLLHTMANTASVNAVRAVFK